MRCHSSPGTGHCGALGWGRAVLAVVFLVFASLPTTAIGTESVTEAQKQDDESAECDEVGFIAKRPAPSRLKPRRVPHSTEGKQAVQTHPPIANSEKGDGQMALASVDHDHGASRNHDHGHARSHQHSHRHSLPSARRRRRQQHPVKRTFPSLGGPLEEGEADVAVEKAAANLAPAATTSSAGLTFIQIGSSLANESIQEPLDDADGSRPAVPSTVADHPTVAAPQEPVHDAGDSQQSIPGTPASHHAVATPTVVVAVGGGMTVASAAASAVGASLAAPKAADTPEYKLGFASLTIGMFALAVSLCAMAARFIYHTWQHRRLAQGVRERAEKLRVTHGAELESMFGLHSDMPSEKSLSPGVLMRIQGRVVCESQGTLVAPLSGQQCVMYSASVSHQRHDGIHQPVSFRSESTDFAVELSGSPHLRIAVHSQDVVLFDMVGGMRMRECALAEAPESWRAFLLSHCVPGQDASSGVALGRNDSLLDFRESALMQGVEVTCIGEIVRDRNGSLGLYPWRPSPSKAHSGNLLEFVREDPAQIPSQLPVQEVVSQLMALLRWTGLSKPPVRKESLAGCVMISDDPEFLA